MPQENEQALLKLDHALKELGCPSDYTVRLGPCLRDALRKIDRVTSLKSDYYPPTNQTTGEPLILDKIVYVAWGELADDWSFEFCRK
jgi:hypothetical protein